MGLETLRHRLWNLDGKPYPHYKQIRGSHDSIVVDHVQGDPFAAPSRVRYFARQTIAWCATGDQRRATADFLLRALHSRVKSRRPGPGSGKSGRIDLIEPGQQVLQRTAVLLTEDGRVEVRARLGLPARGRRIMGQRAAELLCDELPALIEDTLNSLDTEAHQRHVEVVEDAVALRDTLSDRGWAAFVGDGSILPRRAGHTDLPLEKGAIPFESPPSLAAEVELPHSGRIRGMAISDGVTLVVGGGFHGKSTLLSALQLGVYDHTPGDGRERVVSRRDTVKIRAEDGRLVCNVNISPFIQNLPNGHSTSKFSTDDASGSTSQAASISEALALGARVLLLDEDTSATNLLIRDERMAALVPNEQEPITPLLDRIGVLKELGCSVLMVVGGSSAYFEVANTVIGMNAYRATDLTHQAREITHKHPLRRTAAAPTEFSLPTRRVETMPQGRKTKVRDLDRVSFGETELDLSALEQLVEKAQTRGIAALLDTFEGQTVVGNAIAVEETILRNSLAALQRAPDGDWSEFRRFELAGALNRLRGIRISVPDDEE